MNFLKYNNFPSQNIFLHIKVLNNKSNNFQKLLSFGGGRGGGLISRPAKQ